MNWLKQTNTGWQIDFRHNGVRFRRRVVSRDAAEELRAQLISGDDPKARKTLSLLVEDYLEWSTRVANKTSDTVRRDRQRLTNFVSWAGGQSLDFPSDVKKLHISQYQDAFFRGDTVGRGKHQKERRNSKPHSNWNKYKENIRAFFQWLLDREIVSMNPVTRDFTLKLQEKPFRIFTPRELSALFKYFDLLDEDRSAPYLGTFFKFLAYTGVRLSEAMNLRWEAKIDGTGQVRCVDFRQKVIKIIESKSKKMRAIPIHPKLLLCLRKLPTYTEFVFDSGHGGHLYTDSTWWKYLRHATEACEIPPARLHDFRHTFGTSLGSTDTNLKKIADLMGHSDIKSTLRYVNFNVSDLVPSIKKLPY